MSPVDVTVYENTSERTYAVPQHVVTIVSSAASAMTTSEISERDTDVAVKLLTYGRITADDATHIYKSAVTASGEPNALLGGEPGKEWVSKILAGIERDANREILADLAKIDYDSDRFYYLGLADIDSPNSVDLLARVPTNTADLYKTDVLTAAGEWIRLDDPKFGQRIGVALDRDVLAFVASAFLSGHHSVLLHDEVPICFLPEVPMLAAGSPMDIESGGHVYAVVDATDTTAVLSVIKIIPGPQVYTRNGGAWTLDQNMLDSLMSVSPPPIVELNGDTLKSVIEQTDTAQAQQVAPDSDGSAQVGDKLVEEQEKAAEKAQPSKTNTNKAVTASARLWNAYDVGLSTIHTAYTREIVLASAYYRTDEAYQNGFSIEDAEKTAEQTAHDRSVEIRRTCIASALSLLDGLRSAEYDLERIVMPAVRLAKEQKFADSLSQSLVAAGESESARARGHAGNAERLRQYWLHGKGAMKIRWGTPDDATRCHKKLRKYLGNERAWGYCNLLHKRAVGFYTGDKRNTGPQHGVV